VEVAVNLKKVVTWLVIAFVVFYVIQEPERSADLVRNAGEALGDAASSLSTFVESLV
jgi:large-conductance mechanosensitive channel